MKFEITVIVFAFLVVSANAFAQEQDKFGLGLIVGEPTGLSLKYWLDEKHAVDGALAWALSENDSFQLHSDYLIHNYELFDSDVLPAYYGVGALLMFKDNEGIRHHDETVFGIRIPLGITYLFEDAPLDLFFELVPVIEVAPDVDLDINVAVGIRFYF